MIPHRFTAALVGAALVAALTGCASPDLDADAGARLQASVVAVAESAAGGDLPAAVGRLDELQAGLGAAIESGSVTAARAARIQAAIDIVRADLDALLAPAPAAPATEPVESTAPTEPVDTGDDPVVEDSGNSGNGGNGNSGNGNNGNGNGNGNGKKKDK